MPDAKDALVGVKFHHGSPPYEAGDVAGFPRAVADRYVAGGRAAFLKPVATGGDGPDPFASMTRTELIAYAREHLGLADTPPAEISDDEIRDGLRAAAADASAATEPDEPAAPLAKIGGKAA